MARQIRPGQLQENVLYNISASFAISASHEITHELSSSYAETASFAVTASHLLNNPPPFPFTGDAQITGSLVVSGTVEFRGEEGTSTNVVIGPVLGATSANTVVIGNGAGIAFGGQRNVAIGDSAIIANNTSFGIALGHSANVTGTNGIALGYSTVAQNGIALGRDAEAIGVGAIAIGRSITATADQLRIGDENVVISASLDTGDIIISGSLSSSKSNSTASFGTIIGETGSYGRVDVDGDVYVSRYIRHTEDKDTHIEFLDNKLQLHAGNLPFITLDKDASTPYPLTINNGGNRINFRIQDKDSNLLFKTNSEEFWAGLYFAGNRKLVTKTDGIDITGSLTLSGSGHITASGNISSSGTIVASNLSGTNTGDQDLSSFITNSQTASMSVESASFAVTASHLLNNPPAFPFTGDAVITGSLVVSGSGNQGGLRTSTRNIILGQGAGNNQDAINGPHNVMIGFQAGYTNTTGDSNVCIGQNAGYALGTNASDDNIFIGKLAGAGGTSPAARMSDANYNIGLGYENMLFLTSGDSNIGFGFRTMRNISSGKYNLAFGDIALYNTDTGQNNIGIGYYAGFNQTSGNGNITIGSGSLGIAGESNQLRIGNGNTLTTISASLETGDLITPASITNQGTTRPLFTTASIVYSGSNVTQVTQSFGSTEQITNILYSGSFADGNPLSIAVTGSDGINKLYTLTYSASLVTQIIQS